MAHLSPVRSGYCDDDDVSPGFLHSTSFEGERSISFLLWDLDVVMTATFSYFLISHFPGRLFFSMSAGKGEASGGDR